MKQARIEIDRKYNVYIAHLYENMQIVDTIQCDSMEELGAKCVRMGYNLSCGHMMLRK